MKIIHLPPIAIGTGLLLVGLWLLWPSLLGKSVWSDQQAHERSRASADLHRLVHEHHDAEAHGGTSDSTAAELREAEARYERSDAQLQRARSLRDRTAAVLKWAGILLLAVGAGGYWILQRAAAG